MHLSEYLPQLEALVKKGFDCTLPEGVIVHRAQEVAERLETMHSLIVEIKARVGL